MVFHLSRTKPQREFPPSGVLGVIRVALAILDDAGAETGMASNSHVSAEVVTFETAFGRVVRSSVSASNLTWEMASRVLGRPHRYSFELSRRCTLYINPRYPLGKDRW